MSRTTVEELNRLEEVVRELLRPPLRLGGVGCPDPVIVPRWVLTDLSENALPYLRHWMTLRAPFVAQLLHEAVQRQASQIGFPLIEIAWSDLPLAQKETLVNTVQAVLAHLEDAVPQAPHLWQAWGDDDRVFATGHLSLDQAQGAVEKLFANEVPSVRAAAVKLQWGQLDEPVYVFCRPDEPGAQPLSVISLERGQSLEAAGRTVSDSS